MNIYTLHRTAQNLHTATTLLTQYTEFCLSGDIIFDSDIFETLLNPTITELNKLRDK